MAGAKQHPKAKAIVLQGTPFRPGGPKGVGKQPQPKQPWVPKTAWATDFRLITKGSVANWLCNKCADEDGDATRNWGDRACCFVCGAHPPQKTQDAQRVVINAAKRAQQQAKSPTHRAPGAAGCPWNKPKPGAKGGSPKDESPKDKAKAKDTDKDEEQTDSKEQREDEEELEFVQHQLAKIPKGDKYASQRAGLEAQEADLRKKMRERLPPNVQAKRAKFRLEDARKKQRRHEEAASQSEEALQVAQKAAEQAKEQLDRTRKQVTDLLAEYEKLKPAEPPAGSGAVAADEDDDEDTRQQIAEVERLQADIANRRAAKAQLKASEAAAAAGEQEEQAEEADDPMGGDPFDGDAEQAKRVQVAMDEATAKAVDATMVPREGETEESFASRKRMAKQQHHTGRKVAAKIGEKPRTTKASPPKAAKADDG